MRRFVSNRRIGIAAVSLAAGDVTTSAGKVKVKCPKRVLGGKKQVTFQVRGKLPRGARGVKGDRGRAALAARAVRTEPAARPARPGSPATRSSRRPSLRSS